MSQLSFWHLDSSVQCKLNFHPKMFKNWVTQSPKQQIIKTCCTLMRQDDDAISTSRGTPEIYIEALSHQLALISNPVSFSFCLSLFSSISSFITCFFPFSPVLTEQTDSSIPQRHGVRQKDTPSRQTPTLWSIKAWATSWASVFPFR